MIYLIVLQIVLILFLYIAFIIDIRISFCNELVVKYQINDKSWLNRFYFFKKSASRQRLKISLYPILISVLILLILLITLLIYLFLQIDSVSFESWMFASIILEVVIFGGYKICLYYLNKKLTKK